MQYTNNYINTRKHILKNSDTAKTETTIIKPSTLTRKQAAKYLQVSLTFLDTKIKVPKIKLGKSVRYLITDLDEFLLQNRKEV